MQYPSRIEAHAALPRLNALVQDLFAQAEEAHRTGNYWLDSVTNQQLEEAASLLVIAQNTAAGLVWCHDQQDWI